MRELQELDNVFDMMTSFEWLEEAYRNARKKKRYRTEVLEFSNDLDANLIRIQEQLRAGTFVFGPYRRHWVYVPKKRQIAALPFDSRVVHWAIYLLLNPFYDKMFIEDSYACRKDKGSLRAALRLQYWLKEATGKPGRWTVIKIDISKYFYRIDHEVLIGILRRRIRDPRLMNLLERIARCDGERFGLPRFTAPDELEPEEWLSDVGEPIGNLPSQLFANIYLNELDQYCKHTLRIRRYVRYMDDVVIVVPDRAEALRLREQIRVFLLEQLHLDVNQKTVICSCERVEFVGYIVTPRELRLRKSTAARIRRSFRGICRKYFSGEYSRKKFDRSVASYSGILAHVGADSMRRRLNEIYSNERMKHLNTLQTIETLCGICMDMARIIVEQESVLQQYDALTMENEIEDIKARFIAVHLSPWPEIT